MYSFKPLCFFFLVRESEGFRFCITQRVLQPKMLLKFQNSCKTYVKVGWLIFSLTQALSKLTRKKIHQQPRDYPTTPALNILEPKSPFLGPVLLLRCVEHCVVACDQDSMCKWKKLVIEMYSEIVCCIRFANYFFSASCRTIATSKIDKGLIYILRIIVLIYSFFDFHLWTVTVSDSPNDNNSHPCSTLLSVSSDITDICLCHTVHRNKFHCKSCLGRSRVLYKTIARHWRLRDFMHKPWSFVWQY